MNWRSDRTRRPKIASSTRVAVPRQSAGRCLLQRGGHVVGLLTGWYGQLSSVTTASRARWLRLCRLGCGASASQSRCGMRVRRSCLTHGTVCEVGSHYLWRLPKGCDRAGELGERPRRPGTIWGPHAVRDHERPAEMRSRRTALRTRTPCVTCRNGCRALLGVRGSQVQILSARP